MGNSVSSELGNSHEGKPGLLNRVFNQTLDGKSVASALHAASALAVAAGSLAFASPAEAQSADAATRSGNTPIHVAVMAQGSARSDYGHSNMVVNARADSSNDFRKVHAAPGSARSAGATATAAMLKEMRIHSSNPIVVHAYDPFVADGSGQQKLNLAGVREMAQVFAKTGVKVAMVSFSISNSRDGQQMSQIMKANGIAVVAPAPDNGASAAPDILTVEPWDFSGKAKPAAHFQVNDDIMPGVGRIAATGAIYAQLKRGVVGSQAIGFAIQDRFDQATNIVERQVGGMTKMMNTVGMVPGIRISSPGASAATPKVRMAALHASAGQDR